MTININNGAWRTIKQMLVNVGGTWQTVKSGWVNVGGTWRQFFAAGGVTITPASVSARGPTNQTATVSGSATGSGTPSGGTYQWTQVSGDTYTTSGTNAATCTWSRTVGPQASYSAVWRCTYTVNGVAASQDITVQLSGSSTA